MQSDVRIAGLLLIVVAVTPAIAQPNLSVITLERTACFGMCPAYLLRVDSSGAVSFKLMRAAGLGNVPEIRHTLQQGVDINGGDETGWTALMIAAVQTQTESVSALLEAGARVDQTDLHGDTALIGASAVRFANIRNATEVVRILLAHGASPDATNHLGESALMWAARSGNPDSIKLLLKAGAKSARRDQSGHDALFYLRDARDGLTFDEQSVARYRRAELVLEQR